MKLRRIAAVLLSVVVFVGGLGFGGETLAAQNQSGFENFITLSPSGTKLIDGDKEFRFVSFNIAGAFIQERDSWKTSGHRLSQPFEQEDIIKSMAKMNAKAVRTYVIPINSENNENSCLLVAPGEYNEDMFKVFDNLLALANKHGVRLIIPFIDKYSYHGGIKDFANLFGVSATEWNFYNNRDVINGFKQFMSDVLNRTNSITGVKYKDDKAVMAWETGNELSPPDSWTAEIAEFFKEQNQNQLLIDGKYGISDASLENPDIDIVSNHYYGESSTFLSRVESDLSKTKNIKPFIIGEYNHWFSLSDIEAVLNKTESEGTAGVLAWLAAGRSADGGFLEDGNLHYPGQTEHETELMELIRSKAFGTDGVLAPTIEAPESPEIIEPLGDGRFIAWRGSVGATSYDLQRSEQPDCGFSTILSNLAEGVGTDYKPAADKSVEMGKTYYYRMIAKNAAGQSAPSKAAVCTANVLCDNFSGGIKSKTFSASSNLKTETVGEPNFPELKTRVLRNNKNSAELVYKTEGDISGFEIDAYLESWNQNEGLLTLFLSQDGVNYSAAENVEEVINASVTGSGIYGSTTLRNTSAVSEGMRYLKIVLAATETAGVNWNPILDCVRIFVINTDKLKDLIGEVSALDENEFPYDVWSEAQAALENARSVLNSEEKTQQTVDEAYDRLRAAADELYECSENTEILYDDFSGGMDLKTFSRSDNLKTEDVGAPYFPEEKTCVLRSTLSSAELVYKTAGDIRNFSVMCYLESWNQNKGLTKIYTSQNGEDFTELSGVTEEISLTTTGSGYYGQSVLRNSTALPSGVRFLKIKLEGTQLSGVDWNPILRSVEIFSKKMKEVERFSVLNSSLEETNGTLTAGKHYLEVNVNKLSENKSYFCLIALYSGEKLIDFKLRRISIDKNSINGASFGAKDDVSVSVGGDLNDKKIKAFIWSSESLSPVMPVIAIGSK